jgi:hypothetical protein
LAGVVGVGVAVGVTVGVGVATATEGAADTTGIADGDGVAVEPHPASMNVAVRPTRSRLIARFASIASTPVRLLARIGQLPGRLVGTRARVGPDLVAPDAGETLRLAPALRERRTAPDAGGRRRLVAP